MGCDIHIVLEHRRRDNERWVGVYATDRLPGGRPKIAQRDYEFFGWLAGVRCCPEGHLYPRNVPEDISELAWREYMKAPTDHHSASHLPAAEFCAIHHKANPSDSRAEFATYDLLGVWADEAGQHRVVFWFNN